MAFDPSPQVDPALLPYLCSTSPAEACSRFDSLWRNAVVPAASSWLRRKGVQPCDFDELLSDVAERLWRNLEKRREEGDRSLGNLAAYVRHVAGSALADRFRRDDPGHRSVQQAILAVFEDGELFTRWKDGEDLLCGPVDWCGAAVRLTDRYRQALDGNYAGFVTHQLENQHPSEVAGVGNKALNVLVAHLFVWLGTPVPYRWLARQISLLLNAGSAWSVSLEAIGDLADEMAETPVNRLITDEALVEAGTFFCGGRLTPAESGAVMLRFERAFIARRMRVSPVRMAGALGYHAEQAASAAEFKVRIWDRLAYERDLEIAAALDLEADNETVLLRRVSNARKEALRKMANWFRDRWAGK